MSSKTGSTTARKDICKIYHWICTAKIGVEVVFKARGCDNKGLHIHRRALPVLPIHAPNRNNVSPFWSSRLGTPRGYLQVQRNLGSRWNFALVRSIVFLHKFNPIVWREELKSDISNPTGQLTVIRSQWRWVYLWRRIRTDRSPLISWSTDQIS